MISIELKFKKVLILVLILIFGLPIFLLPQKLDNDNTWLNKAYNKTIGNEWYRGNDRPFLDSYLGGSFRLFNSYVFESTLYNRNKETKLFLTASMEKGATVHQMNAVFLDIENYLNQYNEIKQFTTNVNDGDYGNLEITFKDSYSNSSFPFMLKSLLVKKVVDYGGVDWNIYDVGNGFNNNGNDINSNNLSVKAKGYNYDELNKWADSLKLKLETHPRIHKVIVRENNKWSRKSPYEYRFTLNK